jgi:protocatechuate 3,4-dioxygenase beta subunit
MKMVRLALLPASRSVSRRRALCALVATALLPVGRAGAQPNSPARSPTPSQPEGPFYPKTFPADRDFDLTQVLGRAAGAQGTRLYLSGRLFTRDGKPLGNATVELWQCDVHGRYHHVGDDGVPRDDNFQGYGVATTDAEGRYAFKTIRPVPYGGRPPHLHLRVRAGGGPVLTTQIYIAGDALGGDSILSGASSATVRQLTMALAPVSGREPGALGGTFDFVLR